MIEEIGRRPAPEGTLGLLEAIGEGTYPLVDAQGGYVSVWVAPDSPEGPTVGLEVTRLYPMPTESGRTTVGGKVFRSEVVRVNVWGNICQERTSWWTLETLMPFWEISSVQAEGMMETVRTTSELISSAGQA